MKTNVVRKKIDTIGLAILAFLCLSLALLPPAVSASSHNTLSNACIQQKEQLSGTPFQCNQSFHRQKPTQTTADPPYEQVAAGVFESTFTANVPGIQGATHIKTLTSAGTFVGGWI
jgi:hypothetical protein